MDWLAIAREIVAAALTASGIAYGVIALFGARAFTRTSSLDTIASPAVSILKPLKGTEPRMYEGLVSHCRQAYAGEWEILFGVSSLEDDAVIMLGRLRVEYPHVNIRLIECPLRLGANGKVSTLAQMLPQAAHELLVVNDSDIVVTPDYLRDVVAQLANDAVGLVTAPYCGHAVGGLWSRLEALGISTDFMPGVLTARKLEGGLRFGLGSTLATKKSVLAAVGGFEPLLNQLADDYQLGSRISAAGYRVELARTVVETTVPRYTLRQFCDHQLRWARSTRDSRRAGYLGLGVTYSLPWALLAVVASGGALWSFSLLSLALLIRVAVVLTVGVGVLRDGQVLRDLLLLPLRDFFGLFFWVWSYAGDIVVWRGEKFRLKRGVMHRV
jgi:ceramide glucosyltransferase